MHWFRKRRRNIARGLLAAMGSLWLVAATSPCVMAQPHQMDQASFHCPMDEGIAAKAMSSDCGPVVAVGCQLPDLNSPPVAAPGDLAVTPVLLTTLPVSIILPRIQGQSRHDFSTPDIPAPPLHIQHLTLIL